MSKRPNSKTECKPPDVSKRPFRRSDSARLKRAKWLAHYLRHGNATSAAIAAGYSRKTANQAGHRLLTDVELKACIKAAHAKIEDDGIAGLVERKKILTEIARARLHQFGTAGADGFIPDIGPENINSAGLGEVTTRVEITGEGDSKKDVAHITKISLRCPMKAIDLLNKMDGVYVEKHEHSGSFVLSTDPELDKAL